MIFPLLLLFVAFCNAYPEQGHFEYNFKFEEKHNKFAIPQPIFKSMFKKTDISLQVYCKSKSNFKITVNTKSAIIICKNKTESDYLGYLSEHNITCHDNEYFRNDLRSISGTPAKLFLNNSNSFLTTSRDGFYWLNMTFTTKSVSQPYDVKVKIDTKSWYGMLSGRDWPLLIFYSIMCGIYSIFALIWLVFSCRNWRDLLRIQFWIGGVILLGMLEKAMFVSEFQAINNSGIPLKYPMLTAEIVSCVKRMLARILLMIVCIGYGIVKQRLGPAMKKIIGVGVAYLLAALVEGYFRVLKPELTHSRYTLIPELVLVILDAIILWWSFSYLIETIKQMRMKHNVVKFNLYRHFSNILIIVVVASAVFMIWALYVFKSTDCLTHWKEMWLNEAYWHILFSIVLLTIMILWRPSKNSQRYAYSPLLDADDDLDEEDDDNIIMDNMTSGELRKPSKEGHQKKSDKSKTMEDELRWIEDNIPASAAEKIYPLVDSDSEITPSKLTAGKMD